MTDWLARVTTAALKATWYQKWVVHRRLRPEAFAGRVYHILAGTATYPVHPSLLGSRAVEETLVRFGSALVPNCVMPKRDGAELVACDDLAVTIGYELNKLAYNVSMGRNFAGIHYRSDADAGLRIGEEIAISVLQDLVLTLPENFEEFTLTRFDGSEARVRRR